SGVSPMCSRPSRTTARHGAGPRRGARRETPFGGTMAKEVFARTKPHVNVGTIGHIDHGKTTLTAAVSARQAHQFGGAAPTYDGIAKGGGVRDKGKIITIAPAHVEYETANR